MIPSLMDCFVRLILSLMMYSPCGARPRILPVTPLTGFWTDSVTLLTRLLSLSVNLSRSICARSSIHLLILLALLKSTPPFFAHLLVDLLTNPLREVEAGFVYKVTLFLGDCDTPRFQSHHP